MARVVVVLIKSNSEIRNDTLAKCQSCSVAIGVGTKVVHFIQLGHICSCFSFSNYFALFYIDIAYLVIYYLMNTQAN